MAILKDLIVHSASRFIGKVYASGGIVGDLTGTAEKATKDASGNTITSYYEPKSNVTSKGSATQPIYFDSNGVAQNTTYTLSKSVPSDAKFTDTTYNNATTSAAGLMSSGDKTALDNLKTYVGDTAVSTQISTAISSKADLDANGKVPSSQLPSFVDDVVEGYLYNSKFYKESGHTTEIAGETGKIYVDLSNNKTYRYSGSAFVVISETLALGTTSSTAFRGDYGNTAYTHSQAAHAPSNAQKNVQSDWNATSGDALILNKPSIPTKASDVGAAASGHTHDYLPLSGGTMSGDINFSNTSALHWNSNTYRQKIVVTDDSDADTAVFTFQQSTNSGSSYGDLMTIKDNGSVVATTFVGALSGNANTATKATQDGSGNNIVNTYATKTALKNVSDLVGDTAVSTQINNSKLKHSPSTTTKAYVTGTSTSTENTNDQTFDTGVYLSATAGRLETGSVTVGATSSANGKCAMAYNTTDECVSFVFS